MHADLKSPLEQSFSKCSIARQTLASCAVYILAALLGDTSVTVLDQQGQGDDAGGMMGGRTGGGMMGGRTGGGMMGGGMMPGLLLGGGAGLLGGALIGDAMADDGGGGGGGGGWGDDGGGGGGFGGGDDGGGGF